MVISIVTKFCLLLSQYICNLGLRSLWAYAAVHDVFQAAATLIPISEPRGTLTMPFWWTLQVLGRQGCVSDHFWDSRSCVWLCAGDQ